METIVKVIKAMFFSDGEVDIKMATKCKYIVYGVMLTLAAEVAYIVAMPDEDEEPEHEQVEELGSYYNE